jgi:hypothetical protein
MSAYMCSERELTVLAAYAVEHCLHAVPYEMKASENTARTQARVFSMLVSENLASLGYLCPARANSSEHEAIFDAYTFDKAALRSPAVVAMPALHIIKLCHHYAYQSCEHPGWEASAACKLVRAIEAHAVRDLPGYDAAPWGL